MCWYLSIISSSKALASGITSHAICETSPIFPNYIRQYRPHDAPMFNSNLCLPSIQFFRPSSLQQVPFCFEALSRYFMPQREKFFPSAAAEIVSLDWFPEFDWRLFLAKDNHVC